MRIVVNGCFDLFHKGHEYILSKALEWAGDGGAVKVLLNSDYSIRQLKGLGRPVNKYEVREAAVQAFIRQWCLDRMSYPPRDITWFDVEEQLGKLIDQFRPDMILKGNDRFDIREIVGSDKWPVCILPRLPGYSTTEIVNDRVN